MSDRIFITSSRPIGQNLEWESLRIVGQDDGRRARSRQRLLVALAGMVLVVVLTATGLALR